MDRPGPSRQSVEKVDKVEVFEVREQIPYHAEVTQAPSRYDAESRQSYTSTWDTAWLAICQLFNLLHHMQVAIVVFVLWHFALTVGPNGSISNLQLHIIFAGTGYQLFLVEAVMTLHRHNSWSSQMTADGKGIVHGCLQLIGSVFVIAGTFLGLAEVGMTVNTPHGICGMFPSVIFLGRPYTCLNVIPEDFSVIAFGFSIISFASGVITLFSSNVRLIIKNGPAKVFHISVGLFALAMGLITMILGFNMDYFSATQGGLSTAMMVIVLFILMYILVQPITDLVKTTKRNF